MCDVMMFLATLLFLVEITFDWAESNVSQSRCTSPHNTAATLFWVIFEINENRFPIVPAVSKGIKSEYKEELAKVVSTFTSLLSLSSPTIWAVHAPLIKHREEIFTLPYNFYGNLDFLWICCINRAGAPSGAVVV